MTAANLLIATAGRLGVRLEPRGRKLGVVSSVAVPPAEWAGLVEGLAEHKADVLSLLAEPPRPVPAWVDDPLLSIDVADVRAILDEYTRFYDPSPEARP